MKLNHYPPRTPRSLSQVVAMGALIFLVAFGIRLLSWHDTRQDVGKVQSVVASDYQHTGRLIKDGGLGGFFNRSGPLADPNLLGHPPGYPLARAVVASVFGDSDTIIQFFQITCDALAAVVIFLIAVELTAFGASVLAGFLAAFSPQFTWNSVLLLPDTLAIFPILMAAYFLVLGVKKQKLVLFLCAGLFIGVSCWLRANALMMAPFLAILMLIWFRRESGWRYGAALMLGAIIVVAPLTIRNWIVFQHFIPVSLGAGQTMLEGIADYDPTRRFGIPDTDMGIMKMEAEQYNRPDYYSTLFAPDGIKRERMRLARGFGVVSENPIWFAGVMVRRAGSMLRLERARLISSYPPPKRTPGSTAQPIWIGAPSDMLAHATQKSGKAQFVVFSDGKTLQIISDDVKYGMQLETAPLSVSKHHDYLFKIPVLVEEGRMTIDAGSKEGSEYGSTVIEKAEVKVGDPQPRLVAEVPFVSTAENVALSLRNAAPANGRSVAQIGTAELFDLGATQFLWTRLPRILVRSVQRLFITAIMLPLALIGLAILVKRRAWLSLGLLLAIPAYYFCFQSILHTEYRYVLAIHYFLFVMVGVTLYESKGLVTALVHRKWQTDLHQ